MTRRTPRSWMALLVMALAACGPPPAPETGSTAADYFTLTTAAGSETWTEGGGTGATVHVSDSLSGRKVLTLHVPGDAATERFLFIYFDAPATPPADVAASFTYTVGGVSWTNTSATLHVASVTGFVFSNYTGSFTDVVLTGPGGQTMIASGAFYAMEI